MDPTIPPPASEHADAKLDRLARLALWQTNRSHADQSLADRDSALNSLVLNLDDPDQRDFGEYELISLLGKGGMGVVYLAKQRSLDRDVAIKLLIDGMWSAPEFIERLRREAHSAARMQHPNIVEV